VTSRDKPFGGARRFEDLARRAGVTQPMAQILMPPLQPRSARGVDELLSRRARVMQRRGVVERGGQRDGTLEQHRQLPTQRLRIAGVGLGRQRGESAHDVSLVPVDHPLDIGHCGGPPVAMMSRR
jgi:hypothetical protein